VILPLADPAASRPGARSLRTVRSASRPTATEMRSSSTEKRGRPLVAGKIASKADMAVASGESQSRLSMARVVKWATSVQLASKSMDATGQTRRDGRLRHAAGF